MVQNSVTIFFQGHDHLFAKEELDGIVYQEVPQPSSPTGSIPNAEYYFGDVLPASGYLRVTVSGSAVKVDYIRTYLPGEGTNGEVAYTYTIPSSAPTNFTITVTKSGSGSGTVTSVPSAIDCGNTCNASFPERSVVNLTAEVNAGSTFSGWTGCDSTSGDVCTVLINGDRNISASFAKSYRGTVGSQITLTNFGYGIRKGRVLIENAPTRIINWNDSSITFQIRKSLSIGLHNIVVKPIEPRGAIPITLGGVLTMMAPEIVAVDPASGAPGDVITLSGNYFGTIKPRVFIEDSTSGRKKYCRITYRNMEPTTGQSTLSFITPKLPQGHNPGAYLLKLNNRIGTTETTFTVDPIPP
jgi:hypothetical protein